MGTAADEVKVLRAEVSRLRKVIDAWTDAAHAAVLNDHTPAALRRRIDALVEMADGTVQALIKIASVRTALLEGLRYHEHDGHDLPKKVVRDVLVLLGVPYDEQP